MRRATRRELVAAATATAMTASVPPAWGRLLSRRVGVGPGRFRDGVASGEPGTRAVTFWSRLRTDRPRSGARLIVATDPGLDDVVATTVVPTGRGIANTLKARIGGLDPYTEYYYAWQSASHVSEVGRTRTRPPDDAAVPLRIAFSSCQNYNRGYFSPHVHAAAEPLDLYMFLGDYIYERGRIVAAYDVRQDHGNANDLRSYRRKYRLYRGDEGLRELHRVHPAVHIWDDHELENNYSDNRPLPPAAAQRSAAYRAAFEWIPRVVYPRDRYRIYKSFRMGAHAELFLLDERQYRTGHGDGRARRLLGDAQLRWLIDGLTRSTAQWKIVAQQVSVARHPFGSGPAPDSWDGYAEERELLLGSIERAGIPNVVFLTGDAHVFSCNLLASDFEALGDGSASTPAAVEYVGGSVTSPGTDRPEADVQAKSPWNRQYNGRDHGYALLSIDGEKLVTEYRRSDLGSQHGATEPFERFTQPAGGVNTVQRERLAPETPPPV